MPTQILNDAVQIDVPLVIRLITSQFPQWAHLPISPVKQSGWDNRMFHLGAEMSVRLPSGKHYASAVTKEQTWLPRLAPDLPRSIPKPLGQGEPSEDYPWQWSVYRWLQGDVVTKDNVQDLGRFAFDLAGFLRALQAIDTTGGPTRKLRGGSLELWRGQAEQAIDALSGQIDNKAATEIWTQALEAPFEAQDVWYHGDMTIAWTFLEPASRQMFRERLAVSDAIWHRGRGWALWKAMIVLAKIIETNAIEAASSQYAVDQVIADYKLNG
ncbi:MAG: aminoglycoside phosphotransferase (APT) family kinase protein [Candidatus Azotimanducaceae bacterium]